LLETSSTIADKNFSILIDLGATENFISSSVLKIIKVKVVEHDEIRYIEMASGAKQKVGGRVTNYRINLGYFVMKSEIYVTILRSYDVVIGMDWLELHNAILNCKTKRFSLTDNEGHKRAIIGRIQGVSLQFISSLHLQKSMRKGCKLYEILVLNDKGKVEGL
jgi:predicted aspartyl protease